MSTDLEKTLTAASDAYYSEGNSLLSDKEYDDLLGQLKEVKPTSPLLTKVGKEDLENSKWLKATHEYPVGSLKKFGPEEQKEAISWNSTKEIYIQEKLDGISIVLTYDNGTLQSSVSRGDGKIGEQIFRNVLKMDGIPKNISDQHKIIIRGEIILKHSDFEEMKKDGFTEYKNCRNACCGIAKRLDGQNCEYLTVVSHGILNWQELDFTTENECLNFLHVNGFEVVTSYIGFQQVQEIYKNYVDVVRDDLDYDIDGLVLKINKLEEDEWEFPTRQIAWKFPHCTSTSFVRDIEWSVSGGTITPVALIDPTEVAGVTISRISLANIRLMKEKNIKIGSKVEISRRNDVIPHIEQVLDNSNTTAINIPVECPICGKYTEMDDNEVFLTCINPLCPSKLSRSIFAWCNAHDTKGFSEDFITKLIDERVINSLGDFLRLPERQESVILSIDGLGKSKYDNLMNMINKTKKTTVENFLVGINFEDIGRKTICKIIEKMDEKKVFSFKETLEKNIIEGVGDKTKNKMLLEWEHKLNMIEEVYHMVKISDEGKKEVMKETGITGKSFCVTGALNSMKRPEFEKLVRENGGLVMSMSKKLNYLVTNDTSSGTSKNVKAKELGISIINEEEFFEMLKG